MLTTTRTKTNAHTLDALARRAPATDDLLELAKWLAANGPAHLSAIERVELADRLITRRRFLIGAGTLVLAGCGAPGASTPTATVAATRTVDTPRGPVEIPSEPQRLLTLYTHDLENALILGLSVIGGPGEQGWANAPFPPISSKCLASNSMK